MFIFETNLSKDEVKERFLSRVEICETNPRRNPLKFHTSELPRGNIVEDALWFDYLIWIPYPVLNLSFRFHPVGLFFSLYPTYHEFRGEVQETENGTKIVGVFSGHPVIKFFIIGFALCLILISLIFTSISSSFSEDPASIFVIVFVTLWASGALFITNKLHAKQTEHMIRYLKILWNATCRKE